MDLSIVIASHETRTLLEVCLDAIGRAQEAHPEIEIEVLVVDNASRDGSPAAVLESDLRPRLIALVRNRGFAAAVNRALRLARGRHVLLLNTDVEVEPDALALGVQLLDKQSDVGIVGVALRHSTGRAQRCVHAFPGLQTELIPEPLLRRLRPMGFERSSPSEPDAETRPLREVEAVRGAVFFICGELLEQVGLLDEGYFFFLEETDYCWRVREAGYRVAHAESIGAIHWLGASSKRRVPLATRIEFHRSLYRFLERRRGKAVVVLVRGIRCLRALLGLLSGLLVGWSTSRGRKRFAERWGLLLWHLRGCPAEPSLADALRADSIAIRAQTGEPEPPDFHSAAAAAVALVRDAGEGAAETR